MLPSFKTTETQLKIPSIPPRATPPSTGVPRNDRVISIIGPDLTIDGDLISKGELRIDGVVQGSIHGIRVVLGEQAHITGGLVAEDVVVLGHVMGSVRGLRVSLQSTSHVEGDVYHQALVIEQGAYFEGKSTRSENPLTVEAEPEPIGFSGTTR
jgi:cytoskeletal protein CcmA (bactofilin family)